MRQGNDAIAFDVLASCETFSEIADKVPLIQGSVQDTNVLLETIKKFGITHVVHMASLLTTASQNKPWDALNTNVIGTANVLETSRIMDIVQIVYMSSTAVYGYTKQGEIIDEEYAKNPVTIYGATKLFCEHMGSNYNSKYGLGFTALRFPIVYGPGQSSRGFSSFKEIVEKPIVGMSAKILNGGDQEYDGVYVKDVAKAIVAACARHKTEHRAFNIGTGVPSSLRDVAEAVRKTIPNANVEIGPGFDVAEPIKGPLSIQRAKNELRFTPEFDLQAGVNDYIRTVRIGLRRRGENLMQG